MKETHTMKNLLWLLLLGGLIGSVGCDGSATSAPSDDELSQYVEENPHDFDSNASVDDGDTAN
ncbi:MAG TPA: hypothetical protein DDX19_27035 [Rhodopirellula baltica]|uniref:Secreted protein n=2 Tax=Rhodopirellula baltica TaxID=265606 RepID=F2AX74_RHOBT|nr:secreted protein [Rhodopirellula baltica WH47]HBE66341.1 hypothetical protein [Rhodopirellula baltica]